MQQRDHWAEYCAPIEDRMATERGLTIEQYRWSIYRANLRRITSIARPKSWAYRTVWGKRI